jgi:hypothetical protein
MVSCESTGTHVRDIPVRIRVLISTLSGRNMHERRRTRRRGEEPELIMEEDTSYYCIDGSCMMPAVK